MTATYYPQYDDWFDFDKDKWMDGKCSDLSCKFCRIKPLRPLKKDAQYAKMENNRTDLLPESNVEKG